MSRTSATSVPSGTREGAWRLAAAPSVYLREAAHQRVNWFPWGEEAFGEAKRSRRPILLDIGASWCHWCHVMDEGTYSDPEVVRLINEFFVPVKVDRDQHPEIDRRYQRDVNLLTGGGGWPLTAFLTPDGETLLGGTYFPPRDQGSHPGMVRVLREVSRLWREEPASLRQNQHALQQAIERMEGSRHPEKGDDLVGAAEAIALRLDEAFDRTNGGFGSAPKFPHPTALSLLLAHARKSGDESHAQFAALTLRKMAEGGVYDQLGGGFHRYSVDEGWHIPHFEKMAIDNAHLLGAYSEAAEYFGVDPFRPVIEGILRHCLVDLRPQGSKGFAASVDADSGPEDDGSYYTWSKEQLRTILSPDELRTVQWRFGLGADGSMPTDPEQNVLYQLFSPREVAEKKKKEVPEVESLLETAVAKMVAERGKRPPPAVDPAVYSSLNGWLIGSFARAGRVLGRADVIESAGEAADLVLGSSYSVERGVAHRVAPDGPAGWGLLEDQVAMASGLLELAEVTGVPRYLEGGRALLDLLFREFLVPETGLLRDVAPGLYDGGRRPQVADVPSYPLEDSPHLSANAGAALAWIHLSDLTEDPAPLEKARSLLRAMTGRVHDAGLFAAGTALAVLRAEVPPVRIVVEGKGKEAEALYRVAVSSYHPRKVVFRGRPTAPFAMPDEASAVSGSARGGARALLCRGTTCLPPFTTSDALAAAIRQQA